jgi:hypothetical protein
MWDNLLSRLQKMRSPVRRKGARKQPGLTQDRGGERVPTHDKYVSLWHNCQSACCALAAGSRNRRPGYLRSYVLCPSKFRGPDDEHDPR